MRRKKFRPQTADISRHSPDAKWKKMWASVGLRLEANEKAQPLLALLHKHSFGNRAEISLSGLCGCFYCLKSFHSEAIQTWWDSPQDSVDADTEARGITAVCPLCGMDTVLGDQCGYVLNNDLLTRMQRFWFDDSVTMLRYSPRGGGWSESHLRRQLRNHVAS